MTFGSSHNVYESTGYNAWQVGWAHQMLVFSACLSLSFLTVMNISFFLLGMLNMHHGCYAFLPTWLVPGATHTIWHPLCWTSLESCVLLDNFHLTLIEMAWNHGLSLKQTFFQHLQQFLPKPEQYYIPGLPQDLYLDSEFAYSQVSNLSHLT